jgi:hypothetical protein
MIRKVSKGHYGRRLSAIPTPARLGVLQAIQSLWFQTGREGATLYVRPHAQGTRAGTWRDLDYDDHRDDQIVVEYTVM